MQMCHFTTISFLPLNPIGIAGLKLIVATKVAVKIPRTMVNKLSLFKHPEYWAKLFTNGNLELHSHVIDFVRGILTTTLTRIINDFQAHNTNS